MTEKDKLPNDQDYGERVISGFKGVGMAYGLHNKSISTMPCGYWIWLDSDPNPQVRGYRQDRILRGKKTTDLPDDALHDEVLVLPGAGISPESLIGLLEKLIIRVKSEGLQVGKAINDMFCMERIDKTPRFVADELRGDVAIEKSDYAGIPYKKAKTKPRRRSKEIA